MNEKVTKKVGEAFAFAQVLETTFTTNQPVLEELLADLAGSVTDTTTQQKDSLKAICDEAGTSDILVPKAEKTGEKITKMGEMYVGDDWDDSAEVLEWMSFFVGGAIVHWQLIAGAGASMEHARLKEVADEGVIYYEEMMQQLKKAAVAIGESRAQ